MVIKYSRFYFIIFLLVIDTVIFITVIIPVEWKAHLNLLQEKVPHWIVLKSLDGIEHIRIDKKVEFEETVIKTLTK